MCVFFFLVLAAFETLATARPIRDDDEMPPNVSYVTVQCNGAVRDVAVLYQSNWCAKKLRV